MDTQIDLYKTILYNYESLIYIDKRKNNKRKNALYIDKTLKKGDIAEGITHIKFGNEFDQMLKPGDIPNGITHITFSDKYNKPLRNTIDNTIQTLKYYINEYMTKKFIDIGFDNNINEIFRTSIIPNSVTHLTFSYGSNFNQSLKSGDIPNSVTHLTFGYDFNQPLKEEDIPNSVIYLAFGISDNSINISSCFNQPLKERDIPNSVTHLIFGNYFNQPLNQKDIPDSVTHLKFRYNFKQEIDKNNISKNIIEIIVNNAKLYLDLISKFNILIGFNSLGITYNNRYFVFEHDKQLIYKYIKENLTKEKLIGNIICKELIEKVFHPKRLLHISNIYNIDIEQLLHFY